MTRCSRRLQPAQAKACDYGDALRSLLFAFCALQYHGCQIVDLADRDGAGALRGAAAVLELCEVVVRAIVPDTKRHVSDGIVAGVAAKRPGAVLAVLVAGGLRLGDGVGTWPKGAEL